MQAVCCTVMDIGVNLARRLTYGHVRDGWRGAAFSFRDRMDPTSADQGGDPREPWQAHSGVAA
jgi:hypothetical protein